MQFGPHTAIVGIRKRTSIYVAIKETSTLLNSLSERTKTILQLQFLNFMTGAQKTAHARKQYLL